MELKDEIRIRAPRERVFAALNDPEVLREAIPGCEDIEAVGEHAFAATVTSKVGPLKARFKGKVTLSDIVPPESYTLTGEGKGGPAGHAKIRSEVRLTEDGPDATMLKYEVRADIGGKLAQLGGHLVEKTSQKLSAEFFARLETILNPESAETPDPAVPDAGPAQGAATSIPWGWIAAGAVVLIAAAWLLI